MSKSEITYDAHRKRYYAVSLDLAQNPRFEFLNEDQALIEGRRGGTHRHQLRDLNFFFHVGLPPLAAKPRIQVGIEGDRRRPPLDFYGFGQFFVSNRLKELLCVLDPDAFEMVECEAVDRKGNALDPYWWIDVIRVLDCVDEESSVFTRQTANVFSSPNPINHFRYLKLQDIRMRPELNAHAFKLAPASQFTIFDDAIVDACRQAGMRGMRFTPLQPPAPDERAEHLRFENYPYWTDKGFGA